MRRHAALLCLLLATGCAGGTEASLTAQDAQSALAAKNGALSRLAQTQLGLVSQAAQVWSSAHGGDMTGFADDLRTSQPSVAAAAVQLSDTSVTVMVGGGQCLTAQLPAGAPAPSAC